MSGLSSGVDLHHYKFSVQVRWEDETIIWPKEDLQQYVAFIKLLQLSEFSSCDRDQNLPVPFQYIDFLLSQFMKVAPNLLLFLSIMSNKQNRVSMVFQQALVSSHFYQPES